MKAVVILIICLAYYPVFSQTTTFDDFISDFKPLELPLDSIQKLAMEDTLSGKLANDLIISKKERPKFYNIKGELETIKKYYGLFPEEPFDYGKTHRDESGKWVRKIFYYRQKVQPIGRLELSDNYITIIIKVVAWETTYYDLWSFDKKGKVLSSICLFWGMCDVPDNEIVTYTIVQSQINKSGQIIWHENNRGLETFRTYELNSDGYFKIVKEEQKGVFEY